MSDRHSLQSLWHDNRGASEILGYVIIFALIISVIGFVTTLGMPALTNVQDAEQASNAERAFDVVGDNLAAVYERDAPSRSTEIDLGDSTIYYGDPVTVNVTVWKGGTAESNVTDLRPIVLRVSDETSLIYEGGAVFRTDGDNGLVLRNPPMLLSSDRVHVPVVKTTAPAVESAGGTTILLRGESSERSIQRVERSGVSQVNVSVESPRHELWKRYFEEETALTNCDTEDQRVECQVNNPETVYVTLQEIEVSLIL
jgi:hypothetical protein